MTSGKQNFLEKASQLDKIFNRKISLDRNPPAIPGEVYAITEFRGTNLKDDKTTKCILFSAFRNSIVSFSSKKPLPFLCPTTIRWSENKTKRGSQITSKVSVKHIFRKYSTPETNNLHKESDNSRKLSDGR